MIDLHCHILPGLDDGARDVEECLNMARIAAADGIRIVVATPHIGETMHNPDRILGGVYWLNNRLRRAKIPLSVIQGGDVSCFVPPEDIPDYTINASRYFLLEFPHTHLPGNATELLFQYQVSGFVPILTHPERIPSVIEDPDRLLRLLDGNVLVQLTADSLLGTFGKDVRRCAEYLLKKRAVHVLATDAHSATYRKPRLAKAVERAAKLLGRETAQALVWEHPRRILLDRPLA